MGAEAERRSDDRRRLVDRRSPLGRRTGGDQRRGERRALTIKTARNRRAGRERRRHDRRLMDDRRHEADRRSLRRRRGTPTPYSNEELSRVHKMFAVPGQRASCPACRGAFTLGPLEYRGNDVQRVVSCTVCSKQASVTNPAAARIILIENRDVVRETLRAILVSGGHEVVEAADAAVGLDAYRVNPADVVFVNVSVVGSMDAGTFVRTLKRESPDARVVAVSGRTSVGLADPLALATRLGATRGIRIPLSRVEILKVVDEVRS